MGQPEMMRKNFMRRVLRIFIAPHKRMKFYAYLYITGYGYSTTVGASWLAPLVEAGEGVSISFHFDKQSKEKILAKISQQTMMNRSRMRDVADTRQDFEELDSAIASGMYLKDVMNRQGEDFYYMHTLIEVTAGDPETLEHRVTAVEKLCVSVDIIARRCEYKQEQAFLSMLPILYLDPDIERKSRRNALTSGVAAAFPFASYELSDRNGIFLGLNMYNRSPVFLNPYDDYKYTNGNIWIGGSSGAGKTFTLQCVGGRLRQQGKRVIYIIPKKGHEFRPRCEQLGGLYLRMSPSSPDCPNIMAIRRKSLDTYTPSARTLRNADAGHWRIRAARWAGDPASVRAHRDRGRRLGAYADRHASAALPVYARDLADGYRATAFDCVWRVCCISTAWTPFRSQSGSVTRRSARRRIFTRTSSKKPTNETPIFWPTCFSKRRDFFGELN